MRYSVKSRPARSRLLKVPGKGKPQNMKSNYNFGYKILHQECSQFCNNGHSLAEQLCGKNSFTEYFDYKIWADEEHYCIVMPVCTLLCQYVLYYASMHSIMPVCTLLCQYTLYYASMHSIMPVCTILCQYALYYAIIHSITILSQSFYWFVLPYIYCDSGFYITQVKGIVQRILCKHACREIRGAWGTILRT
jgi:hypothetical protein